MTIEEMKNALITSHDEGVDSAAVYDGILTEVSASMAELEESKKTIEELTGRVADLTDTNLKLLEKVKYMTQEPEADPEPEAEIVTIDNLFEEV